MTYMTRARRWARYRPFAGRTFTVTILTPSQMTSGLAATTSLLGFQQGSSLLQKALTNLNGGSITAACNQLGAFVNQVRAQTGKQLAPGQATTLIAQATRIMGGLACR
jgi:hypothetical protein